MVPIQNHYRFSRRPMHKTLSIEEAEQLVCSSLSFFLIISVEQDQKVGQAQEANGPVVDA